MDDLAIDVLSRQDPRWPAIGRLLVASFPDHERRPLSDIQGRCPLVPPATLAHGPTFAAAHGGAHVQGFAVAEYDSTTRLGYLWYLVVDEADRGRGVGTALLRWVLAQARATDECDAVVVEVDPADDDETSSLAWRRIRFYERSGFALADCVEIAPPFSPSASDPDRYWIMARSFGREPVDAALAARALYTTILGSALNGRHADAERYLAQSLATIGRTSSTRRGRS